MEDEVLIKKRYSIPYELFGEAFRFFQKKFVYPRNMVMTGLMLLLAILNVVNIVIGNGETIGYVLVFACLAIAFVNWYNPRKLRRNLMESIKGIENDVYVMTVFPDKLVMETVLENLEEESKPEEYEEVFGETKAQEQTAATEIFLNKNVRVIERKDFFMIYIKRSMFYVVPKSEFSEEECEILSIHFKKQLDKNFTCQSEK